MHTSTQGKYKYNLLFICFLQKKNKKKVKKLYKNKFAFCNNQQPHYV